MSDKEIYKAYLLHLLGEQTADNGGSETKGGADIRESFRLTLESIAANVHIRYGSRSIEGIAELVAEEVAECIDNARDIIESQSPFRQERNLWMRCKEFDNSTFDTHWPSLCPWLRKRYSEKELDISFYNKELMVAMTAEYDCIRVSFFDDWGGALLRREIAYELEALSQVRRRVEMSVVERVKELYNRDVTPEELGVFWGLEPGRWREHTLNIMQTYAAINRNNKSIRTLLDELGRMGDAEGDGINREEVFESPVTHFRIASHSDIDGVGESDRLNALLPAEIALLGEPQLELQFYKKYVEKGLQTFDFRSKEPVRDSEEKPLNARVKPGPYIVCIDTSGSMAGKPEEVAKAICYGLLLRALAERRACYVISFSTSIRVLELSDWRANHKQIVDFLIHSFYGGTDLEPAIKEALRMLAINTFSLADVLVISDFNLGNFRVQTSKSLALTQARNVRFHSLEIGGGCNRSVLQHFDVQWRYNHRTNKIEKR